MALEMTRGALALEDTPLLRRRERRLRDRLERARSAQMDQPGGLNYLL
jgi:hypothetical protein